VNGYKDGTFRPGLAVTRGALVKMAVQAAGWDLVKPQRPTFTDIGADSPLYGYVEASAAHGLLAGVAVPGGAFQPENAATRGEAAAIIARTMTSATSSLPESWEAKLKKLIESGGQK
jgi:hypothetical protein